VGDSRVYLVRDGRLTQVTRDHSWVEEQVRHGTLTATAARRHPWRNVVTRALAGGDDPEVDVIELKLQAGDRLLLCSDGLSGVLTDEEIEAIVVERADLQSICDRLVAAANAAGGPDNVTALLLQVDAL
ncbi:MAG TPA: SpoIIE family protein phosphatase, partial [Vicinamibacterales bacterium]|nr:SpoIIE family protein phosphatase [Vicinamibacterales bacterium]